MLPETPHVALREELRITSELIRKYLGRECIGLRTPFGYYRGLRDRPDLLEIVRDTGHRFVTSWGRNEQNGNPTPWVQPFAYAEEGFPDLLEIPFQFWLDGIWFDANGYGEGARVPPRARGRRRRGRRAGPRLRDRVPRVVRGRGGRGGHRLDPRPDRARAGARRRGHELRRLLGAVRRRQRLAGLGGNRRAGRAHRLDDDLAVDDHRPVVEEERSSSASGCRGGSACGSGRRRGRSARSRRARCRRTRAAPCRGRGCRSRAPPTWRARRGPSRCARGRTRRGRRSRAMYVRTSSAW